MIFLMVGMLWKTKTNKEKRRNECGANKQREGKERNECGGGGGGGGGGDDVNC